MKTIRTNCFETNSSSTHSITVNAPSYLKEAKATMTFMPDDEGKLKVRLGVDSDPESSPHDKLRFALSFAYNIGDQAAFDRIIAVVEGVADVKVECSISYSDYSSGKPVPVIEIITKVKEYDHTLPNPWEDTIDNSYCAYLGDYGHGSIEDLVTEGRNIIETEESILVFIFTNHCAFERTAWYNG